jgi:RimJ/RimL family protein N-acetyltransferase
VRAVARYGFEHSRLDHIFAVVEPENVPSWHVLERLGFVHEKDVTHDKLPLAYYALRREKFVPGEVFYRLHDAESS